MTPAAARSRPSAGRHLHAADGGVAGADDRHARRGDGAPRAATEQHRRRQRVLGQILGVARPAEDHDRLVVAAGPQRLDVDPSRLPRPPGAELVGALPQAVERRKPLRPSSDHALPDGRQRQARTHEQEQPAGRHRLERRERGRVGLLRQRWAAGRGRRTAASDVGDARRALRDRAHAARRACSSGSMRRLSAVLTHSSSIWPWQPRRSASVRATRRTRCSPRPLRRSASSSRRRTRRAAFVSGATSSRSGPGIAELRAVAARRGRFAGEVHPDHDVGRGLARGHPEELVDARTGDLEPKVEAVQQRPGDPAQVAEARALAAPAGAGLTAGAARARVHGGHELEAGRELHRGPSPGDPHHALLERLAQPVQHRGLELAELVQEEHPPVGQRDLARTHAGRPAAHHRHQRCRVVRRPQRWPADQPVRQGQAGRRVDHGGLQRQVPPEEGQQPGQALRQHRLARARVARAGGGGGRRRPRPRWPGGP